MQTPDLPQQAPGFLQTRAGQVETLAFLDGQRLVAHAQHHDIRGLDRGDVARERVFDHPGLAARTPAGRYRHGHVVFPEDRRGDEAAFRPQAVDRAAQDPVAPAHGEHVPVHVRIRGGGEREESGRNVGVFKGPRDQCDPALVGQRADFRARRGADDRDAGRGVEQMLDLAQGHFAATHHQARLARRQQTGGKYRQPFRCAFDLPMRGVLHRRSTAYSIS